MLFSYFNTRLKKEFQETILSPTSERKIHLQGLVGSAFTLFISEIANQLLEHQIFIFPEREEALYFYRDIEKLTNDEHNDLAQKKIHYFPSSYRRGIKLEDIDTTNVKLRTEIIHKLVSSKQPLIIVTYPEAIAEKIISPTFLKKNSFSLHLKEKLPVDIFLEFLYSFNYKREDFVFEPGQFAWRGAIFDIFSFSEEYPYRIELEGEEIISIRQFNPTDQLSIKEVSHFQLIPLLVSTEVDEERVDFFDFLPKKRLWLKEIMDISQQLDRLFKKIEEWQQKESSEDNNNAYSHFFIDYQTFLDATLKTEIVEINSKSFEKYHHSFDFQMKAQHSFGKSFDLLFQEWIDNYEKGIQTFFLSENESQLKRIHKIMVDLLNMYNEENLTNYLVESLFTPIHFSLYEGFRDEIGKVYLYTDHQFLEKYYRFDIRDRFKKSENLTLKEIYDLQIGDYVVHINHGIGIYAGLQKMEINGKEQEVIRLTYKDGDTLFVNIHSLHKISKYVGKEGTPPTLHRLGSGVWEKVKERAKKRVKELAIDLIKIYAARKMQKGFAFSADNYLQTELEASFIYEDTPDQIKSIEEVKRDMEANFPMDRLICGDVGFGKTEVAIRSAFKAVCDSKQVAVLVPTTVLALQHFTTFSERLENMPCNIEYINRFKTTKQIKEVLQRVKTGQVDILIGTYRILSKDVIFKDLGLLIIDEEQKFGVAAKEKLRETKQLVDTLTMSATPIPRTLHFSLMGARDISVISTPPPNRYPIQTELHLFNEELIRDAISYEMSRGGQVFFVHNKIQNIDEIAMLIQQLVPDARIAVGHGQMDGSTLEQIMTNFIHGDYDVLIATTIVESGLDITNANTMIINDAQNFALNILHQLRGRVGRNNKKAFCYLLIRSFDELNDNARKRLKAIEELSDIGSGFQIAMRDLDIRGAGDILGAEQSGFIHEIGFETYQKILAEAMREIHESGNNIREMADNSAIWERECVIETDLRAMFPTEYVNSTQERMSLYKEVNYIKNEDELEKFRLKLIDLFGPLPEEALELLQLIKLRKKAITLFLEKIVLKKGKFVGYFSEKRESPFFESPLFEKILLFLQKHHPHVQLKEENGKLILIINHINSIKSALAWLEKINENEN